MQSCRIDRHFLRIAWRDSKFIIVQNVTLCSQPLKMVHGLIGNDVIVLHKADWCLLMLDDSIVSETRHTGIAWRTKVLMLRRGDAVFPCFLFIHNCFRNSIYPLPTTMRFDDVVVQSSTVMYTKVWSEYLFDEKTAT